MTQYTDAIKAIKGYVANIPAGAANMSAKLSQKDPALFVSAIGQMQEDGEMAISRRHGLYEKVIYNKRAKKDAQSSVLVYLGPKNDFSEYKTEDVIKGTMHYWGVAPEHTLEALYKKALLVLPCPKRVLNNTEVNRIKGFLGSRKVVIFSGEDTTIASGILRQLNSKLDILPDTYLNQEGGENIEVMTGWINGLVHTWVAKKSGFITVHKDYWSTAILKDWNNVGLLYSYVTTLTPYINTVWEYPPEQGFLDWMGSYMYSSYLANKIEWWLALPPESPEKVTWTVSWNNSPMYPAGYFPVNYNAQGYSLASWGAWMSGNVGSMPMYYIRPTGYFPPQLSGPRGYAYTDHSVAMNREWTGACLAYIASERIIVASFKPAFLTDIEGYPTELLDSWFTQRDLANWLVSGALSYVDTFNQGGFAAPAPCYPHCEVGGWSGGTGQVIQF